MSRQFKSTQGRPVAPVCCRYRYAGLLTWSAESAYMRDDSPFALSATQVHHIHAIPAGTPMLSMKAAAFHRLDKNESSGAYSLHDFFGGGRIHPGQEFSEACCSVGYGYGIETRAVHPIIVLCLHLLLSY
jgi:hypothetical protein